MAGLPKNAAEAVDLLGVAEEGTVIVVGPGLGYAEALADAVGTKGTVYVLEPPPDLTSRKKAVKVVDELPSDASGDPVILWVGPVAARELRDFAKRVDDGGALWVVVPRSGRDVPAPVSEGDVRKSLMVAGWREDRTVGLSSDAQAIRFHRRR